MTSGRLKRDDFSRHLPEEELNHTLSSHESVKFKGLEKSEGNGAVEEMTDGCETSERVDDVLGSLSDLQFGGREVDLSEVLTNANDQRQEDELLVIESIYGDKVYALDKWEGLRSVEVHIDVEIADELEVSVMLNESKDVSFSEDIPCSFKVQHLPPIVLTCLLPKSYPSHSPPSFNISVQWLDSAKISSLCTMLDSMWIELPGQEILYQWVEWLHASSLSHLGLDKRIVLGPYGVKHAADRRAVSASISPDIDIATLKSYNEDRCHESFLANVHECCICFSEYAGTYFIKLPCHHFFCKECMGTYANMHIKEGTVHKLHCPNEKCKGELPPGLLKSLLVDEEFARLEALILQKRLESMREVVYCPRCETACIEDKEQHAQCSKCLFSFCALCREKRHVGIECMSPERKLYILLERQKSSQLADKQKRKEQDKINELLSITEILKDTKQCPSCKMAISKTSGCNKVECGYCGNYFCYRCNQAIDGYDHFREGSCALFPSQEIEWWEEHFEAQRRRLQVIVQVKGRPCPICRQENVKVANNNHILCRACQTHYCYLCRLVVRSRSQHFGPKGCKQHSAEL